MNKSKLAYQALTLALLPVALYLYAKGFALRSESFGSGISHILLAVLCLGLALVTGAMALLESASDKYPNLS